MSRPAIFRIKLGVRVPILSWELQGVAFNKDRFETSKKKKNGEMSTMDVIRSPRGKGGRFTKKGEDSTFLAPSNPLLRLASVALATVAVASAQPCLTPSELPQGELAPKRSAVELMNICSKTSIFEVNNMTLTNV